MKFPKPVPQEKARNPLCKCGKACAWYGPVGGYSVACIDCNRKNANRQRVARRTWMRKKAPRRLSRAGSDPAYLAWVRTQPCKLSPGGCSGRIHAHHAIHRSQGGLDEHAIPLCAKHHKDWHECIGAFRMFSRFERFGWSMRAIAATRRAYAGRGL